MPVEANRIKGRIFVCVCFFFYLFFFLLCRPNFVQQAEWPIGIHLDSYIISVKNDINIYVRTRIIYDFHIMALVVKVTGA